MLTFFLFSIPKWVDSCWIKIRWKRGLLWSFLVSNCIWVRHHLKSETFVSRLSKEVGALFLQTADRPPALMASDPGYASLQRRLTVLDRVTHTHSVWLLLTLSQQGAVRILQRQPPGVRADRSSFIWARLWIENRISDWFFLYDYNL